MSDSVWPHGRQPTRLPHSWDSPGKNTGVGCHFLLQCMKVKSKSEVAQSCLTLSDPTDCSLPGLSVHGIFQARVLEWGAIAFSSRTHSFSYCVWLLSWSCCCSVGKSCLTLSDSMDCSIPGFLVLHHFLEFTQTHVLWVGNAIQPSHPLPSHFPPAFTLSQHQGLFKWVSSSHEVAKALEFQPQYQSFQWTARTDLL